MTRRVSVRELRNSAPAVVSKIEAGERLTLTVNGRAVADIVPHVEGRDPWVPSSELRQIVDETPSDFGLPADISAVREGVIEGRWLSISKVGSRMKAVARIGPVTLKPLSGNVKELERGQALRLAADRKAGMSERLARVHNLCKQMSAIKGAAARPS